LTDEINRRCKSRRVKLRIQRIAAQNWSTKLQTLTEPNHEFWTLSKSFTKTTPKTINRPLHGSQGLVYTSSEKAEALADHLETQFMVNAEPYDEATINAVHRYLNSHSFNHPFDLQKTP